MQIADDAVYSSAAIGLSVMLVEPVVERERFDEQHGAARCEVLAGVAGDPDGVAHVVQAVEEADQVERAVVALGVGDLERRAVGDTRLLGPLLGRSRSTGRGSRSRGTARSG